MPEGRITAPPHTVAGNHIPAATESTRVIDWSGTFTVGSGTATAAESKRAIDWAGSFGIADTSANRTDRSQRIKESDGSH